MVREPVVSPCTDDIQAVEVARQELEAARQWFDWVSEPCLVDEAVYRLRAAEMRLVHALTPLRAGAQRVAVR